MNHRIFNPYPLLFINTNLIEHPVPNSSIDRLRERLRVLCESIEELEDVIGDAFDKLENEHKELVNQLKPIEIDIQNLKKKIDPIYRAPKAYNVNTADVSEEQKQECKDLYSKIARQCHPDVTDDVVKNEIFKKASEAHNNYEYEYLLRLSEALEDGCTSAILEQNQIQVLNQEIIRKTKILQNMRGSEYLKISYDYQSGNPLRVWDSKHKFSDIIFEKIKGLLKTKEALEKELNLKP